MTSSSAVAARRARAPRSRGSGSSRARGPWRARAPGGSRRGGRTGSLNVSSPSARPSSWWPRQMPKSGRPLSTIARTSATCASIEPGSPGPFASSTPSGVEREDLGRASRRGGRPRRSRRPARAGARSRPWCRSRARRRGSARRPAGSPSSCAGDRVGEQPARHRRLGGEQRARLLALRAPSPQATREHRAAVAQVAHERAGVELGEHDDALRRAASRAGPCARSARSCAPRGRSARVACTPRRLLGRRLDAVVADHRRRERQSSCRVKLGSVSASW